jgi:uncharacterized membrane protein (UPF0127 family)
MSTLNIVKIRKSLSPFAVVNVKYSDTFWSKFIGLMFSRELKPDHGVILVENNETRINTAIHMMFVNYDITVLWLDKQMVVIDKVLAKKWVPFYIPKKPAQYIVELHQSKYSEYSIGEKLILFDKS